MIYRKLEETRSERDRLKAELDSLTSRETRSNGMDDEVVDRAIEALRDLGAALNKADPADTKRLLSQIVTRIELHFEDDTSGRQKRAFSHGEIYLRPDAGEAQGTQPDGEVTHLNTIGPYFGTPGSIANVARSSLRAISKAKRVCWGVSWACGQLPM